MSQNGKLLRDIMAGLGKPKKVRTPKNQWQTPGQVTDINSRFITMEGVGFPAIGMSPDGTMQLMMSGGNYEFPMGPVREIPLMGQMMNGGQLPTFQGNKSTSIVGRKISNLQPYRNFLVNWNNSPMGKQMLNASVDQDDPVGLNYMYADSMRNSRNALINQTDIKVRKFKDFNKVLKKEDMDVSSDPDSGTAGFAGPQSFMAYKSIPNTFSGFLNEPTAVFDYWNSRTRQSEQDYNKNSRYVDANRYMPDRDWHVEMHDASKGNAPFQTLIHELSHASDAGGKFIPYSDEQKIMNYAYGKNRKRELDEFQDYVADPTETRARLANFRYNAANQKLYDPFTQKATMDVLKKYKDKVETGYDPLQQLRDVYTDDQILDMLNSISKTKSGADLSMAESGGQHGGLDRWFAEKWVDVKTGKACGRQEGESRKGYPACRPSRRVSEDTPKTASELSPEEREKFKRSKTSSERINYQHRRKEYGGEQTESDMANKPNNPSLWSRAKSLAKEKFDVYPSAYANGWAAKWYKSKGGTWRKAEYGMEVPMTPMMPMMADGGKPEWLVKAQLKAQGYSGNALQQKMSSMAQGGEPQNAGFQALPEYVQDKIMNAAFGGYIPEMGYGGAAQQAAIAIAMKKAGKRPKSMQKGGEPDGEMALGQIAAVVDKMDKLRQFIEPGSDLEPWISSKLSVMDHYADAVSDYMMYNPEAQEEMMMEEPEGLPMEQMKNGGIPQRYKNMGFNKVGVKKNSTRPGKKWMVLAKKGDEYKVVHGGYDGMKDFSQHGSEKRKDRFWDRMGGKNSAKAKDPFSPLYWHKRFGTWQDGGSIGSCPPGMIFSEEVGDCVPVEMPKFMPSKGSGTSNFGISYSNPKFSTAYNLERNELGKLTHSMNIGLPQIFKGRGSVDLSGRYAPGTNYSANLSSSYKLGNPESAMSPRLIFDASMDKSLSEPKASGVNYRVSGGLEIPMRKSGTLKISGSYNRNAYKDGGSTWSGNAWYKQGGPVVGEEMEVTPEQAEMLRAQGYDFEII